jgi:hypothetical protein
MAAPLLSQRDLRRLIWKRAMDLIEADVLTVGLYDDALRVLGVDPEGDAPEMTPELRAQLRQAAIDFRDDIYHRSFAHNPQIGKWRFGP